LAASNTRLIGCFEYPPLSVLDRSAAQLTRQSFSGPWPDITYALADRKGIGFVLDIAQASHFSRPQDERPDVIMGVFKTRHRERYYDFSVPLYRIGLQGVCRATSHTFSKDDLVKGDLKMVVQVGEVGWEYVTTEFKRADQRGNIYKIESLQASKVWICCCPTGTI
jgi:ABC-type amino acid transport substrate-binding protein